MKMDVSEDTKLRHPKAPEVKTINDGASNKTEVGSN